MGGKHSAVRRARWFFAKGKKLLPVRPYSSGLKLSAQSTRKRYDRDPGRASGFVQGFRLVGKQHPSL